MIDPRNAMALLWALWAISWIAVTVRASRSQSPAILAAAANYRLLLVLGFVALFAPLWARMGPLIQWSHAAGWLFDVLALAGFGVCWWARLQLGPVWPPMAAREESGKVVETGPYAYVRHPIYGGIFIACLAVAFVEARWIALLGAASVAIGFYQMALFEEEIVRRQLGDEAYNSYAARVPMLVPFLRLVLAG